MLVFKWLLCAGMLAQMASCPKLWMSNRGFPTLPFEATLPELPSMASLALVCVLIGSILAAAALPQPRPALVGVVLSGSILALFDVTRMQPWFFQYLVLFAVLAGKKKDFAAVCAFVLAATYFWSGLQKANISFAVNLFPWLIHSLGLDALGPSWFVVPIVEAGVGVALLFPRTRPAGIAGMVVMHVFLLAALGPFGQNFNTVVWPWNFFLPAMGFVLFFRNRDAVLPSAWHGSGKTAILLTGVLPVLNFVGLWPDNASDALYSGRTRQAFILLNEDGVNHMPIQLLHLIDRRPDRVGIDVSAWAMSEMQVLPYPGKSSFLRLVRELSEMGVPKEDMTLIVTERPSLFQSQATTVIVE